MMLPRIVVIAGALALSVACPAAEESYLRPNDVIATVGGENMAALSDSGYLEAFLTAALPHYTLRFRNLAWEGDTVFEQRRDLNYPSLEQQLEKIHATVVIVQFGQMESLRGLAGLRPFGDAYKKVLERFGERRLVLLAPTPFSKPQSGTVPDHSGENEVLMRYCETVRELARQHGARFLTAPVSGNRSSGLSSTRDGVHLSDEDHREWAREIAAQLEVPHETAFSTAGSLSTQLDALRATVTAKNRLWFHYARPQNWAFLAGDRTSQPSSRDHRDLSKRWFPEELEQFLPLIEAREREIWALAVQLQKP